MACIAYSCYCGTVGRLDLHSVEMELKKRWPYPDRWLQKQNDLWDARSNFIYTVLTFEELVVRIRQESKRQDIDENVFFQYAISRWYNYWSARAVEQIFCEQPGVRSAKNEKDRLIDFSINGVDFDLKTSVFPKSYGHDIAFAKANPAQLINWLYAHQSTGKRYHRANRLFLVVYKNDGNHYRLKAEISWLQSLVADYVSTFDASKLIRVSEDRGKPVVSDIIWAIR